jgi:hypothetical protein
VDSNARKRQPSKAQRGPTPLGLLPSYSPESPLAAAPF